MRVKNWALASVVALAMSALPAAAQSGGGGGAGSGGGGGQSGTGAGQAGTGGATDQGGGGATGQTGGSQAGGQVGESPNQNSQKNLEKFVQKAAIDNMAEIQLSQLAEQKAQDPQVKQFAETMVQQHTQAQNQLQQAASAQGLTLPSSLDSKHQKLQDKLSNLSGAKFDQAYIKEMVKSHEQTAKLLKKEAGRQSASSSYGSSTAGTSGTGTQGTAGTAGTSGTSGESGTAGASGMSGATGTSGAASGSSATTGTTAESGNAGATSSSPSVTDIRTWAANTLPEVQQHLQMAHDLQKQVKNEGKGNNSGNNGGSIK